LITCCEGRTMVPQRPNVDTERTMWIPSFDAIRPGFFDDDKPIYFTSLCPSFSGCASISSFPPSFRPLICHFIDCHANIYRLVIETPESKLLNNPVQFMLGPIETRSCLIKLSTMIRLCSGICYLIKSIMISFGFRH
jgi:hypothetical protein